LGRKQICQISSILLSGKEWILYDLLLTRRVKRGKLFAIKSCIAERTGTMICSGKNALVAAAAGVAVLFAAALYVFYYFTARKTSGTAEA